MSPVHPAGPGAMRGRARAAMLVGLVAVSVAGFAGWRMMRAEPAPAVTYALIEAPSRSWLRKAFRTRPPREVLHPKSG